MKKILILVLVLSLLLPLVSCQKNNNLGGLGNLINDALNGNLDNVLNALDSDNPKVSFGKAASYAQAYEQLSKIQEDINSLLSQINDKHNEGLEYGDEGYTGMSYFLALMSLDLVFTAALDETEASFIALKFILGEDTKVEHPRAHEYNVIYKDYEGNPSAFECKFDTSTGSLKMVHTKNNEVTSFYEFVNLGNNKYAYQTLGERAVVTYKDGVVLSLAYSSYNAGSWSDDPANNPVTGSIYPKGNGADENWVFADGIKSYRNAYKYDGKTLILASNSGWGDPTYVEIPVK